MDNEVQIVPAEPAEILELQDEARDWQEQFHILKAGIEAHGFKVDFDDAGKPYVIPPQ